MTANELIACLVDRPCSACKFHTEQGCSKWTCVFEGKIEELPSAERKGHWIDKDLDNFRKYEVECSECGAKYIGNYDAYDEPGDFNYCPNCGARMKGEEE